MNILSIEVEKEGGTFIKKSLYSQEKLNFEHVAAAFLLLGIGVGIALLGIMIIFFSKFRKILISDKHTLKKT